MGYRKYETFTINGEIYLCVVVPKCLPTNCYYMSFGRLYCKEGGKYMFRSEILPKTLFLDFTSWKIIEKLENIDNDIAYSIMQGYGYLSTPLMDLNNLITSMNLKIDKETETILLLYRESTK